MNTLRRIGNLVLFFAVAICALWAWESAGADETLLALPDAKLPGYGEPTVVATPPPTVEFSGDLNTMGSKGSKGLEGDVGAMASEIGKVEVAEDGSVVSGERSCSLEDRFFASRWELRALPNRAGGGHAPLRKLLLVPDVELTSEELYGRPSHEGENLDEDGMPVTGVEDFGVGFAEQKLGALHWFLGRPTSPEMMERISVTVRNALEGSARPVGEVRVLRQAGRCGILQVVVLREEVKERPAEDSRLAEVPGEISRQARAH